MLSRAHRNFQSNWIPILLAVISIIQGLAFNDLAIRLQVVLDYTIDSRDLVPAAHFVLAFILLLRIFQTYVTAALDYDEWTTNFPDVLLIFVIGLLEYHVFSSLTVPSFYVVQFHKRMSIISVLALIGYVRAFGSLKETMFTTYLDYARERRLQAVNIGGIAVILSMSSLILFTRPLPNLFYAIIGFLASAVLASNIGYSLNVTFSTKLDTTLISHGHLGAITEKPENRSGHIKVRPARREDVITLARLMSEHFGYVYSAVFDTSPRLTESMLLNLLRAANGRIPDYGFRSFQVACRSGSPEVLGLLKCSYSKSSRAATFYWLFVPVIVLYKLGLTGLVRTLLNWRVVRDMVPEINPDELYIQYIAVSAQFQKIGVGSRLIERALEFGAELGKSEAALDVREPNQVARKFFRGHGFREDMVIKRSSDSVLGMGPTIRMGRVIPTENSSPAHIEGRTGNKNIKHGHRRHTSPEGE
jgi:ribosomal protein S18 acetylase RimI-like enzyme